MLALLFAGGLKVEVSVLLLIPEIITGLSVVGVLVGNGDQSKIVYNHCAVVLAAKIIIAGLPGVILVISLEGGVDPSKQHLTVGIKGILFTINGFSGNGGCGIASLVSLTIGLEIVPVMIRLIFFASVLVLNGYPLIANHGAVGIYIVIVVVILDQHIGCHLAAVVQPEPVIA